MTGTLDEILAKNAGQWLVIEILEKDRDNDQPTLVRLLGSFPTEAEAHRFGSPLVDSRGVVVITYEPRPEERGAPVV